LGKTTNPLKFRRIVEIGTALGNTSVFFKLFCVNKKARFYTFDFAKINQRSNTPAQEFVNLSENYVMADVFKEKREELNTVTGIFIKE